MAGSINCSKPIQQTAFCRFPLYHKEAPLLAVDFIADQLTIPTSTWFDYPLKGRSGMRDREQLRTFLGFRPATVADSTQIQAWLEQEVLPSDQEPNHLKAAVLDWCREHKIEPPTPERIDRVINAAVRAYESSFFAAIQHKLLPTTRQRLDALLVTASLDEAQIDLDLTPEVISFSNLKADPGRIGLASVVKEIDKLKRIDALELPVDLFADHSPKLLERYKLRVATESVQELRRHPDPIRYTLLAAFCWQRRKAIIDGLVELLIQIVHRVSVRAERKVITEIGGDLEKVHGKTMLLYRLAEAAVEQPNGVVKDVLFPVAGEKTLQSLVKEYRAKGSSYRRHVHTLLRSSYSHHYRRMLPLILDALTFCSNNTAHQPVIDALAWLKANRDKRQQTIQCDDIPIDGVVRPQLQDMLLEPTADGGDRINRINYEICVLQALRERLRCKEIWVEGADRFRNPDEDLPSDFNSRRSDYYTALNQPQDADQFIGTLQHTMQEALAQFDGRLPANDKIKLKHYGKKRINVTPFDPQPEPAQLLQLKAEVGRRWPMTSLLDVLKETDLRVGFTEVFKSLGTREMLDRSTLQHRLLLCLYGLGTNAGLKRMLSGHSVLTYRELLHIRHRYLEKNALRDAIRQVVNATFAARLTHIWGEGTTACASDGKKFGAWDQNLMTEWHIRYGGRGVMIYWHVEKRSTCIYSQLKRCSSSEVAAMIEGVLRHCTEMEIEQHYVDSQRPKRSGVCLLPSVGIRSVAPTQSHCFAKTLSPRQRPAR